MGNNIYDTILAEAGINNYPTKPKSLLATNSTTSIPFKEGLATNLVGGQSNTPWYQNSEMLGNVAGLGSSLVQLAALPSQISLAKTQKKALEHNLATAKEEQARRNSNISSFNAVRT